VTGSGVAIGAAIVWASPFPFADAAIGQVIRNSPGSDPTGPTGTTGASASTGASAATGATAATAAPGTSGSTGELPYGEVNAGLGRISDVRVKAGSLSFTQEILEDGTCHWWVFLHVPRDHGVVVVRIGTAHRHVASPGEHRIKVAFSEVGRKEAKRHAHAQLSIDTSFVDTFGRRFAKAHKVKR
jgi:hypothetical protein